MREPAFTSSAFCTIALSLLLSILKARCTSDHTTQASRVSYESASDIRLSTRPWGTSATLTAKAINGEDVCHQVGLPSVSGSVIYSNTSAKGSRRTWSWTNCSRASGLSTPVVSSSLNRSRYYATSSQPSFPNFIRPTINPSTECNLWGPLCKLLFLSR